MCVKATGKCGIQCILKKQNRLLITAGSTTYFHYQSLYSFDPICNKYIGITGTAIVPVAAKNDLLTIR